MTKLTVFVRGIGEGGVGVGGRGSGYVLNIRRVEGATKMEQMRTRWEEVAKFRHFVINL